MRSVKEKSIETINKAKAFMNRVIMSIGKISLLLIALGMIAFLINHFTSLLDADKDKKDEQIIVADVQHKLEPISEITTYKMTYEDEYSRTDRRKFLGLGLPLTKNSVTLIYQGVINVTYEYSDIKAEVDNKKKVVYVSLPEPKLTNEIDVADIKVSENDNVLNPIHADVISENVEEIKESELQKALDNDVYGEAENYIKMLIETQLADLDYVVKYK